MNGSAAKMLVFVGKKFACIRIIGRANFTSSVDFKKLITDLGEKGYRYFVLDLSECALMDSTFLGVLAGFGLNMSQQPKNGCDGAIELLNPSARITDLLESLGVLHLFKLSDGAAPEPEGAEVREHECRTPNKEEAKKACQEAHETLMQINPENVAKFKDVAAFLSENVKAVKA
jgi:anti-anti-sigma factor